MICSMTVNGIGIDVQGAPEECAEFFRAMFPAPKIAKKICDPMARHTGHCGAEDCPIFMSDCNHSSKPYRYNGRDYCGSCGVPR